LYHYEYEGILAMPGWCRAVFGIDVRVVQRDYQSPDLNNCGQIAAEVLSMMQQADWALPDDTNQLEDVLQAVAQECNDDRTDSAQTNERQVQKLLQQKGVHGSVLVRTMTEAILAITEWTHRLTSGEQMEPFARIMHTDTCKSDGLGHWVPVVIRPPKTTPMHDVLATSTPIAPIKASTRGVRATLLLCYLAAVLPYCCHGATLLLSRC
jgi:hypothetical protein